MPNDAGSRYPYEQPWNTNSPAGSSFYASSSSSSSTINASSSLVRTASHNSLMRLGNTAYSSLHMQFIQTKCQLDAQRTLNSQLNALITTLSSTRPTMQEPSQPALSHTPLASAPYAQYDEDDYPEARFWHKQEWIDYENRKKDGGKAVPKMGFITNEDGEVVSNTRATAMSETAKEAFTQLFFHRADPPSWKRKSTEASGYFHSVMRDKFPEFRLCAGDWKVELFATLKYPDWCRHGRRSGGLTRAIPSQGKRSADENATSEKTGRKAKRVKLSPPPSSIQIIDIDDEDTTPSRSQPPDLVPSQPMSPKNNAAPHSMSLPSFDPQAPSIPTGVLHDQSPRLTVSVSTAPAAPKALPPPLPTSQPSEPGTETTPRILIDIGEKPTDDVTQASAGQASSVTVPPKVSRRKIIDPLAGLVVPQMAMVTAASDDNSAPSATPVSERGGDGASLPSEAVVSESQTMSTRAAKKGKPMVASTTSTTARNLYAKDYLKLHPETTTAEFRDIYKNIDEATQKKYNNLSKSQRGRAAPSETLADITNETQT